MTGKRGGKKVGPICVCPFSLLAAGGEILHVTSHARDLVFLGDEVMVFVCARQWPNNPEHVLVVPVAHYENIFQHNEPAGSSVGAGNAEQNAWPQ